MSAMKTIAAVALAAVLPTMAQAATFNLTGGSGTTSTATFSAGGIGLNVTAWSEGDQEDVTFSNGGLGVSTGFFDAAGVGNAESLTLTFSQAVTLSSLTFEGWDSADHATVSWAGGSTELSSPWDLNLLGTDTLNLTNATGTVFTIAGTSGLTTFRLAGLNATAVAAVPEPSTYALMGLGLVGIGFAARRRAAK